MNQISNIKSNEYLVNFTSSINNHRQKEYKELSTKSDKLIKECISENEIRYNKKDMDKALKLFARQKQVFRQKVAIGIATLGIMASTLTGSILLNNNQNKTKNNKEDEVIIEEADNYYDETESEVEEITSEEILETKPEVKKEYTKIQEALNQFSKEIGTDGLELIKDRVAEIGNGEVELMDVLKILCIESEGRIYDPENPNKIITSYNGTAFGPFQITPDTATTLSAYYGLNEKHQKLDIMNPYDNLDACIYNLRFIREKRENDIANGIELPTGENMGEALAWSYHDGPNALHISYYGKDYIDKYNQLSILDEYPEVVEDLTNSLQS